MNEREFVNATLLKATGKAKTLQPGDTKYNKIVSIGNLMIAVWENEPTVDWASLYDDRYDIGSTGTTRRYDIPEEVRKFSGTPGDYVVVKTDGTERYFTVIAGDQLTQHEGGDYCAKVGDSLVFTTDLPAGGSILAPVYLYAEKLNGPNSEILIDNPLWLVIASAGEYARNDVMAAGQYGNLVAEANLLMEKMIENNRGQYTSANLGIIPRVSGGF